MKNVRIYHPQRSDQGIIEVPADLVHLRVTQGWVIINDKTLPSRRSR